MGKVTDELKGLLRKQIDDHGIVVWYDPEKVYERAVSSLDLDETPVLKFGDSFFKLRHQIEPFLEFVEKNGALRDHLEVPPRLLVYVPLDRAETRHALVEAEVAGVVVEPGANPWQRNTRLKVVAERVFKRVSPDRAAEIAQKVEKGQMTLSELDQVADQTGELGVVKLIFRTAAAGEVARSFAASDEMDRTIEEKQALPELAQLFRADLGIEVSETSRPEAARRTLQRGLLLSEVVTKLQQAGAELGPLASVPVAKAAHQQQEVLRVCETWRNRTDLSEAYVRAAKAVAQDAGIAGLPLAVETLEEIHTFPSFERVLIKQAESRLLEGQPVEALRLVSKRRNSFWAVQEPENQLRWSLLETVGRLLETATKVETELKNTEKSPEALIGAYVGGAAGDQGAKPLPWCALDTFHRHLERQYATFDLDVGGDYDQLERVIAYARQRYTEAVMKCAEAMTEALEGTNFRVSGFLGQREVFAEHVSRSGRELKTAYMLVDALRFEMARELIDGLGEGFEAQLLPVAAQLPTITDVGMAAVLPEAEKRVELVKVGPSKVALQVSGTVMKDRATRVSHLLSKVSRQGAELKLNELMKPKPKRRAQIEAADFLLVTSQEIDLRGEGSDDEEETRRYIDEVLEKLRKGIRTLARLGVQRIIIAADHGYLYGEALDSGLRIDPPGGQTVDLHRRVWIGKGGAASKSYVRVPAAQVGLEGDLELAFPRGLGAFKSPGSSLYFHGGTSLQEMVIPLAIVDVASTMPTEGVSPSVEMTMDREKITNRLFTVVVTYRGGGLFPADEKRVRVAVRSGRREIGVAATAAYGFEDGTSEVILKLNEPNAITLMLSADVSVKSATIQVMDAVSQIELAGLKNIPVDLAM